uniref:Uncharacterized protein n=1 Tax=Avena sativa TaxID=4498 RepID=A0ACD5XAV1_AVESA
MDTQEKLKVLSGFGGLGKTTLAKHLYDKFRGKFHCEAFFSVSQKPDIKVLLNRLEAKLYMTQSSHARGIEDIIEDIRKHLKEKRYLIVVDDLWDQSVWNVLSRAFPNEGNGSRLILTTRVEGVAGMACHNDQACIYRMKPLNEQHSRMLFFNRVFGSGDGCPFYFEDTSADILKKCGGLPLAIITIASQEVSRSGWENIRNSLGARSTINPTLDDMKNILNLSYMHLPLHLRSCFLHLGMYSEDEEILMSAVIQEWVAEGLVNNLHGPDLMDVGKNYFNELISRSMIQPVTNYEGEMMFCRVHDLMLDLIRSKCAEDNFLSVASSSEDIARLQGCKYKVRRLSLRSMAGGAIAIFGRLKNKLSSDIVHLPCLSYLRLPSGALVIQGVENMKSLRTLLRFDLNKNSTKNIRGLGELTNLRELELCGIRVETSKIEALVSSVGKLHNLKHLDISTDLVTDESNQLGLLSRRRPRMHVRALGKLPSLVWLNYSVTRIAAAAERAVLGKGIKKSVGSVHTIDKSVGEEGKVF